MILYSDIGGAIVLDSTGYLVTFGDCWWFREWTADHSWALFDDDNNLPISSLHLLTSPRVNEMANIPINNIKHIYSLPHWPPKSLPRIPQRQRNHRARRGNPTLSFVESTNDRTMNHLLNQLQVPNNLNRFLISYALLLRGKTIIRSWRWRNGIRRFVFPMGQFE